MLEQSFVHIKGIGLASERTLWQHGATTWDTCHDLIQRGLLPRRWRHLGPHLSESRAALRAGDTSFFGDRLPTSERWRMYADFADRAGYIDIETTGLSADFDEVTVIGLYDGQRFQTFIQGRNLSAFPKAARKFPLLVSFNGAQFDLRFLRATFPDFSPAAHVDLRFPLERLGYSGGLKAVERAFRIMRPKGIREVDGFEAVRLWRRHQGGDRRALERLVEYTRHDVVNLVPLAEAMLRGMRRKIGVEG